MKKINCIVADLLDWGKPYPTGAVAYSGNDVIASEYCETPEEFREFFSEISARIEPETTLQFRLDADDIPGIMNELLLIKAAFERTLEEKEVRP